MLVLGAVLILLRMMKRNKPPHMSMQGTPVRAGDVQRKRCNTRAIDVLEMKKGWGTAMVLGNAARMLLEVFGRVD